MEQANDSNLPVDSAVFLEFLPGSHQYLLVVSKVACGESDVRFCPSSGHSLSSLQRSSRGRCLAV